MVSKLFLKKPSAVFVAILEGVAIAIAIVIAVAVVVVVVLSSGKPKGNEPSVKPDLASRSDFPSPKTWWAKRISSDLYTAGRLTERQIKYAAEAGFGSIISLVDFTDSYNMGADQVPSTSQERDVVEKVAGMKFEVLVHSDAEVPTKAAVDRFAALMAKLPKPVILHCVTGLRSSVIALIYLHQTTGLSSQEIYNRGALLGYPFASKGKYVDLITTVTGEPLMADPPMPDGTLHHWFHDYWLIKPVYKNWYITGQIQSNYVSDVASMGVGVVVNCRQTANSQEEVALLNVEDNTGTYVGPGRQSTERLLATRIDPARRNEYISPHSTVNYERENSLEYGDDIGYNATLEKHDMESKNLTYLQTPPHNPKYGMKGVYTRDSIEASLSTWLAAGKDASVCVHSQSGYRAVIVALVSAARQYGLDSAWAVERASQLGYPFDKEPGQPVVKLFRELLPSKGFPSPKTWWAKRISSDLYTAGRLTERQIKYAAEAGFGSIISLVDFTDSYNMGADQVPSTSQERDVVEKVAGMKFEVLVHSDAEVPTKAAVDRFAALMAKLPKPVILHCVTGLRSSVLALIYLHQTTGLSSQEIYSRGALLGYPFASKGKYVDLITSVTGEPLMVDPPMPDGTLHHWYHDYWLIKPVYKNWYITGQIQSNYVSDVAYMGVGVVVNCRQTANSQEEVALLNVEDNTGTYVRTGRQSTEWLLATRIDPARRNEYISPHSTVNYERENSLEYGDDIGYNATLEKHDMESKNLTYHQTPPHNPKHGMKGAYTSDVVNAYMTTLLATGKDTTVCVHSQTGYRAVIVALVSAARQYGLDSAWAVERASQLGYPFDKEPGQPVVKLFRELLPSKDFPSPKTWWAKRISSDLYTAGRLTERQIKYAAEAGFGSIISLVDFTDSYNMGADQVPSTSQERDVVEKVAGMKFEVLVHSDAEVPTKAAVDRFAALMAKLPKPVILHCVTGLRSSVLALIYLHQTTGLSSQEIYNRGALLGYPFASKGKYVDLITSVTGEPLMADPPMPDGTLHHWFHDYWLIKPVYKNWYITGQIQSNYVSDVASMGVGVVVNCRQTASSQEEVTLLNVEDNTGTYVGTGRQSTERLLATRIDPARRNEYVSPHSTVNYERENSLEYGDDIGYNATLEKHDMESKNLTYCQTPPHNPKHGMKGVYTRDSIEASLSTWLAAGKDASVCVHSQSGYRAVIVALVSAARQYGLDSAWAVERASQLGYPFDKEPGQPVVKLFRELLPSKDFPSPKTWWAKRISSDLYTAGRLTERQIKYAADAGFGSVISLVDFTDSYNMGADQVPSTSQERDVVEKVAGMKFEVLVHSDAEVPTKAAVDRFAALMAKLPKPVILHCVTGLRSSVLALIYLHQTTGLSSQEIYSRGALLGYPFASKGKYVDLITSVTGEPLMADPPMPDGTLHHWFHDYWLIKPVYKNWYITGQIQSNYVSDVASMGVGVVVNCRQTASSQEEVALLNVEDNTGTYVGIGRQSTERLLATRIDPARRNEYISPHSTVNYERENSLEYGDDIGYNATLEKHDMESKNLTYCQTPPHNPIQGMKGVYTRSSIEASLSTWLAAGKDASVCVHSQSGYRAVIVALVSAARQYGLDSAWAVERASQLGYPFDKEPGQPVVKLFRELLPSKDFPSPKTWWAKRISSDLYTAGRLTERQIKYAAEAGFGSIISLVDFTDSYNMGADQVPSTSQERDVVEKVAGMKFEVLVHSDAEVPTKAAVDRFAALMAKLPKPVILHCVTGLRSSVLALIYLHQTTGLSSQEIYSRGALLGYPFASKGKYVDLITSVTGEPLMADPPLPDGTLHHWFHDYWLIKPVYKNWYITGQIQSNYVSDVASMGVGVVVNCRQTANSQEEVALLNVEDNTGTYVGTGRQSTERLLATRIDPARRNEYISPHSTVNYERENSLEYGDDIGYNATLEKHDMESKNLTYCQTPPSDPKYGMKGVYTRDSIEASLSTWLAAGKDATVCVHSQSGYRAVIVALVSAARQYGLDSAWAVERASQLGYPFDKEPGQPVVKLFRELLPSKDFPSPKTWWAKRISSDLYTAGRLTERQIKYAAEAGFGSIISLVDFTDSYNMGADQVPSTSQERDVVEKVAGMKFEVLVHSDAEVPTKAAVDRFAALMAKLPKPVILHCVTGLRSSVLALIYLHQTTGLSSQEIYSRGALLGYPFASKGKYVDLITSVTGEPLMVDPPMPDGTLHHWFHDYWLIKPVYKNWYITGQIQSNYVSDVASMGVGVVVNCRQTANSQEEVALLNVEDNTGTYVRTGRQSTERLLATRIDPARRNEYISPHSTVNYERENSLEYGDDIGYNATLEKHDMESKNLTYHQTPPHNPKHGMKGVYSADVVNAYMTTLLAAGKDTTICVHSQTGYRAVIVALVSAARQYGLDSAWAVERASQLGYPFDKEPGQPVVKLFRELLPSKDFPSPKTWWAKRISSDLYTAGRLTERQIKYAAEAGFGSIISLVDFTDSYNMGADQVPSTSQERDVVEKVAGMKFEVLVHSDAEVPTKAAVDRFAALMAKLPKPVILHCVTGLRSSVLALIYLHQTTGLSSQEIYSRGALLGYPFASKGKYVDLITSFTGELLMADPPMPDGTLHHWFHDYWLIKPVYKNWYFTGQIQSNYVSDVASMGVGVVVNCRQSANSQEEVALLNVEDNTGTYVGTGRQSTERLLATRIDPARRNEYISPHSTVNYERENSLEYGDDIGYNATLEKHDMESKNLTYCQTPPHNPKNGMKGVYTRDSIEASLSTWLTAGKDATVCVHSQSGYRAVIVALVSAARQYGLDSAWAVERASQLGYPFDKEPGQPVVKLFRELLPSKGFPSPKTWWAKRISSDLYTAGRLTERQIKYAAEAGFGSIISLVDFTDSYNMGADQVPSTSQERDVVEKVAGMKFELLVHSDAEVPTKAAVDRFAALMAKLPKPVILHCVTGLRSSVIALIYLHQTTGLSSQEIYSRGALLGYPFASKGKYVDLITSVTGEPLMADPPMPDGTLHHWFHDYWLIKPVYKNWYITGQIQSNYVSDVASMGVGVVVNCRQKASSQEEVALLNVEDNTGTYVGTGRQSTERLLATRIDPVRRNEYISPHSTVNYQRENSLEYGDDIGYNATLEKHDMESKNLTYCQTPPQNPKYGMKGAYSADVINAYMTTLLAAGKDTTVCVHSQNGYRAVIVALVSAARQYGLDSAWAVERASQLGYPFDKEPAQPVVKLFRELLPSKDFPSPKTWWAKRISSDLYTAGRLTERQIKYAAEAGFGSIISLVDFTDSYNMGADQVPSTSQERDVVEKVAGMKFEVLVHSDADVPTKAAVDRFAALMAKLPKPVILHCVTGLRSSVIALIYLNQTTGLSSQEIYNRGALLGYPFASKGKYVDLITSVTGEPLMADPPMPDGTLHHWFHDYWLIKPVYKNWYITGQIQSNYVSDVASMGVGVVVNCRQTANSQEEVALINVRDKTGTYVGSGRQSTERLRTSCLDPTKPNEYVSEHSTFNFELQNNLEYGDHIGYNSMLEKHDMESKNLTYHQSPPHSSKPGMPGAYTAMSIKAYLPAWLAAGKDATVCVHSQSGYRAVIVALVSAARQYGLDSAWAVERASQLGYPFDKEPGQPVVKLFRELLPPNK